jgi:hypothetical protein
MKIKKFNHTAMKNNYTMKGVGMLAALLLMFAFNSPGKAQTYITNEHFDLEPNGWSGDIGPGGGQFAWHNGNNANGAPPEIRFRRLSNPGATRRFYKSFNTFGYTSVDIDFRHMVDHRSGGGYTLSIQYSTDGGTTWTPIWSISPTADVAATMVNISGFTGGIGDPYWTLAFTVSGAYNNINNWYFDELHIIGYGLTPSNIPYSNDFSSCTWPTNWAQQTINCTERWSSSNTNYAGGTACEMWAQREVQSPAISRLVTPPLNTAGLSQITVFFRHFFDDRNTGLVAKVQSSPNGINWTDESWSINSGGGNVGPAPVSFNITNNLGGITYLAFTLEGNLGRFDNWYIDDLFISTLYMWTGALSTDWFTPGNWNPPYVPMLGIEAIIPSGCPNYPVIVGGAAAASSIIIYNGASVTLNSGSLNFTTNITTGLGTSGALTLNGGILTGANITIYNGAVFTVNGGTHNLTGNVYIGNGLSGTFNMTGGSLSITGNLYTSTGSITSMTAGTLSFANWQRSVTQLFGRGNITLSGGIINASNSIYWSATDVTGIINGPVTINVGGNFRNQSTNWTMTDGTIVMNGQAGAGPHYFMAADYALTGAAAKAYNIFFTGAGKEFKFNPPTGTSGVVVEHDLGVFAGYVNTYGNTGYKSSQVTVGNQIGILSDGSMTADVTGTTTVGDQVVVYSTASGTGSWIHAGGLSVGTKSIIRRYLTPNAWHLVTSPVSSAQTAVFLGVYLKEFMEATNSYGPYITPSTLPMDVGKGYSAWSNTAKTVAYQGGTINTGNTVLMVTATDANGDYAIGDGEGWNLVGNPFASSITWNGSWPATNISPTAYFWSQSVGNYATWNWLTGTGTNGKTDGAVPADQGFFVKATGFSPSLVAPQSQRYHSTQAFYKTIVTGDPMGILASDGPDYQPTAISSEANSTELITEQLPFEDAHKSGIILDYMLRLQVTGPVYGDEAVVAFHELATAGYDSDFDAFKLTGTQGAPSLYMPTADGDLLMNVRPEAKSGLTIPVSFMAGTNGSFTISAQESGFGYMTMPVYLEDLKEGNIVNLSLSPTYKFTALTSDDPARFLLHFGYNEVTDNIQDGTAAMVYAYGSNLYILKTNDCRSQVMIYSATGQLIAETAVSGAGLSVISMKDKSGYYIVKVVDSQSLNTTKVYIE